MSDDLQGVRWWASSMLEVAVRPDAPSGWGRIVEDLEALLAGSRPEVMSRAGLDTATVPRYNPLSTQRRRSISSLQPYAESGRTLSGKTLAGAADRFLRAHTSPWWMGESSIHTPLRPVRDATR